MIRQRVRLLGPGLALTAAIGLVGRALEGAEQALFGRAWVEGLVLAIVLGAVIAAAWEIPDRFTAGIAFSARELLELAVCLMGAAIDTQLLRRVGPGMFGGVVAIVMLSLGATYAAGRLMGLRRPLALLLAAGNSICGNSAIAAVAPVIGADPDDVAAAISFTAVLSIAVVVLLPALIPVMHLTETQYGVVAGLTVYAVPQVLAATAPVSAAAGAMATLVKLLRVLLLGPLVIGAGMVTHRARSSERALIPWFIYGFVAMAAVRSIGLLSAEMVAVIRTAATWLTVLAMAALGLGVDVRGLRKSGGRVIVVVCVSLAVLVGASLVLAKAVA